MSASARAKLHRAIGQTTVEERVALAVKAGLQPRDVGRLIYDRPISVNTFLRLCVAAEHDPTPGLPGPEHAPKPGDLNVESLALGLKIMRGLREHNDRDAAAAMGISKSSVCRVENCEQISIGTFLKVCRYLNSHAFGWMRRVDPKPVPVLSREKTSPRETSEHTAPPAVGAAA